ncbi:MAG: hypothetical protein ABSE49_17420 [Polyangiaceae bacterium]|jgi:hypothetical protein
MSARLGVVVCGLTIGAAVAVACANGGTGDQGVFEDGGGDGTTSSSGSGSSGTGSGSTSSSSGGTSGGSTSSTGSGSGSSTSSGSSSGSGGSGDSGSAEGGDEGDDASTADGGQSACGVSPDQCAANATFLGSVAGDESGSPVAVSGYTSEWLRLDETEQDDGPLAAPMIFTATLTSPPGMNYDLYAYLGASGGVGNIECMTVKGQSTNPAGEQDQVSFEWGETGTFANGVDDSATVMIEVRWVSGACTNTQNWSLSAHGD